MEIRSRQTLSGRVIATLVLASVWLQSAPNASAAFNHDDILVTQFATPSIQHYRPNGTLAQTFTGTGADWEGASLTPGGNLVTTFGYGGATGGPGVNIFNPAGTQIASFNTPQVGFPGGISVFANGTLAISDQTNAAISEYDQDGTFVRSVPIPGAINPFGSTVGSDNILYVADIYAHLIARVTQDGTVLSSFSLGFSPGDLVRANDGTFYVSGRIDDLVHHLSATGVDLNDFATGLNGLFDGIGLAADGQSLYVATESSTVVKRFDLAGNALAGGFNLVSTNNNFPSFITVVPSAVPEPSSLALVAIGLGVAGGAVGQRLKGGAR